MPEPEGQPQYYGSLAMSHTPFDIVVPVVMYCAMLWWLSRRMSWTRLLAITAVTLALIVAVLAVERGF